MEHLAEVKLAVDSLLIGAMIYLAISTFRSGALMRLFANNSRAQELRELHAGLQALIREADNAGQSLQEALARRQRSLEQVLSDASGAEQRLTSLNEQIQTEQRQSAVSRRSLSASTRPAHFKPATAAAGVGQGAGVQQLNVFGEPIGVSGEIADSDEILLPESAPEYIQSRVPVAARADLLPEQPEQRTAESQRRVPAPVPPKRTAAPIYRQQQLAKQVEVERIATELQATTRSVAEISGAATHRGSNVTRPHTDWEGDEFVAEASSPASSSAPLAAQSAASRPEAQGSMSQLQSSSSLNQTSTDPRLGVLGMVRRHTQVL